MQSIFLCISIGTALFLTSSLARSEPYDRSVLDLITAFLLAAVTLCAVQQRLPFLLNATEDEVKDGDDTIPLSNRLQEPSPTVYESKWTNSSIGITSARTRGGVITIAIVALTIRIELYRTISGAAQCTLRSWEPLLPLVLAVNECRNQQWSRFNSVSGHDSSTNIAMTHKITSYVSKSPWRYVPSGFAVAFGCYSIGGLWQAQTSTFICPISSGEALLVPRLQKVAFFLDGVLLVIAQELAWKQTSAYRRSLSTALSYAAILFGAATFWIIHAGFMYVFHKEEMQWLTTNDTSSNLLSLWHTLSQALGISLLILSSTCYVGRNSFYQLSMILIPSTMAYLSIETLWTAAQPFPPNTSNTLIWWFLVVGFGFWFSLQVGRTIGQHQALRSSTWQLVLLLFTLVLVVASLWPVDVVALHPIEFLMSEAESQHKQYVGYASTSKDLPSSVRIYQERYHDNPPPGFDKWYEYASNRSVLIMDDYDQIHRDLLPLRSSSPAQLRRQTWEIASNPWNEISGIIIRNGRANVADNVLPTHRWMLEGIATMINSFAEYLPDMDLAFNLNDESRVAVPNTEITTLRNHASQTLFRGKLTWSLDRASSWLPVATQAYTDTVFENLSFQKNFRRFGSIGCPSDSLSKRQPYRSSQSHLCLECLRPHSLGQFVSNWTLSADICHQPDISHLHGFYLSPAAYKTTHKLVPVFSQSKASGYNDILYPSSWNYMDKVAYQPKNASGVLGTVEYSPGYPDPPFMEKDNILYWRGATSEGVSASSHAWHGMVRQRLVHLANNATSDSDNDRTVLLLPDPGKRGLTYHSLSGSALKSLRLQQTADIKFVDHIARCGGLDCTDQASEFNLATPVDFQSHWRYKFLFDLDGAGFSGRFLPFLQSHSLPFKTALFREWYDSRITAWRHFVPIDLRLHGVWSTLAYFAGVEGIWPGNGEQRYKSEAHTIQAETIAEEGRRWANTVLRKEDMEVYFFRLLLEWGRLTDDRRDELGFSLD